MMRTRESLAFARSARRLAVRADVAPPSWCTLRRRPPGLTRAAVLALSAVVAALLFASAPALAAAPEPPELTVASPVAASEASFLGVLNPNATEPTEGGTYQFLYAAGTECEGGGETAPGLALGAAHEELPAQPVTGLTASTEYAVCLSVTNLASETTLSPPVTFMTAPEPPETLAPATSVTATTAVLEGVLNPKATAGAGWYFAYQPESEAPCTGGATTASEPEAVVNAEAEHAEVTGLQPSRKYVFCMVATNAAGAQSTVGNEVSFKTLAVKPALDGEGTSAVKSTEATLEAQVNPNNQETTYSFEYATNKALVGATTVAGAAPLEGFGDQTASAPTGAVLGAGEIYYYRVVAENATGTTVGAVQSFTTAPAPFTDAVSGLTATTATFNGHFTLDPVATQYSFDYRVGGECAGESATAAVEAGSGSATVAPASEATGLLPNTPYTVCFVTSNAFGSEVGGPVSFTTLTEPPTIASEGSSALSTTDAMLEAKVNPNNREVTSYFFEYASEEALLGTPAATTVAGAPPAPALPAVFEEQQAGPVDIGGGLTPGQTYFYRLIAENASGERAEGPVQSFQTLPVAPLVSAGPEPVVTRTTASISGVINPEGATTEYFVEYGQGEPHGAPGSPTPPATLEAHGVLPQATPPLTLQELRPGSTYRYRIVAVSEAGTTDGPEVTFTTAPAQPPAATTGQASAVTQTSATITGTVDPRGLPTSYEFDVGADTSYGTRVFGDAGAGPPESFALALTSLAPGSTYHYRILATNQDGTAYGADATFTTPGYPSPIVEPLHATLIPFTAPTEEVKPPPPKVETRAQKLKKALKACKKDKSRKKRAVCIKQAHRKYGPVKKKKK